MDNNGDNERGNERGGERWREVEDKKMQQTEFGRSNALHVHTEADEAVCPPLRCARLTALTLCINSCL